MADRGRGRGRGARPDNGGRPYGDQRNGGLGNGGHQNGGQGNRGYHNGGAGRGRGGEPQPQPPAAAAGVVRQMGRMALAGPGRAPDRPRYVITEKEKKDKV